MHLLSQATWNDFETLEKNLTNICICLERNEMNRKVAWALIYNTQNPTFSVKLDPRKKTLPVIAWWWLLKDYWWSVHLPCGQRMAIFWISFIASFFKGVCYVRNAKCVPTKRGIISREWNFYLYFFSCWIESIPSLSARKNGIKEWARIEVKSSRADQQVKGEPVIWLIVSN